MIQHIAQYGLVALLAVQWAYGIGLVASSMQHRRTQGTDHGMTVPPHGGLAGAVLCGVSTMSFVLIAFFR